MILKGGGDMQKKIPMRQCLGCREMKPKRDLIRVVRSPEDLPGFPGKSERQRGLSLPKQ